MSQVELKIAALNASATAAGNYVLVLQEVQGRRKLPVIIGLQEAQSIAVALEQMQPVRPLTHDLFLNTLVALSSSLEYVRITSKKDNTYLAIIAIKTSFGETIEIDSRTSDAIALAIRRRCAIYIEVELLTGLASEEGNTPDLLSDKRGQLERYSLEDLYTFLAKLLEKEDYENASKIRDAILKKEQREE